MHFWLAKLSALGVFVMLVIACDRSDQQIKVYRLAKAPLESPIAEKGATVASAAPQINWELPDGWGKGSASAMRYASFAATEDNGETVDISVVTFPGDGGSDLDNVNRWRQQIDLPTVSPSELDSMVAPLQTGTISLSTADMTGAKSRTVAAWLHRQGRSWFFKLTGPKEAVEKEKPNFLKFLQSIRFEKNAV